MSLAPALIELLVDPEDKEFLYYLPDESALYNPRLHRRYAIKADNIPVMLVDESESVDVPEQQRLAALAKADGVIRTGARSRND